MGKFKEEKLCKQCDVVKTRSEYYIIVGHISTYCKECTKENRKKYDLMNPEKIKARYVRDKEKQSERQRKFSKENPEIMRERRKKRAHIMNPYYAEYRKKNKAIINEKLKVYQKERRKTDILFKMKQYMSSRIRIAFYSTGNRKCKKTEEILCCTIAELKVYIESKMTDGMTWDNYGYYGWHIDHLTPLAKAKTEEEIIKLSHYTNLQPMWRLDNQKKGSGGFRNPFKNKKAA